ncbi:toxin [Bathymodiolus japonicus methanotrophic gill symbiont]|uniref:type II toxin-antitoxin system HicA family toxin n=1 Tax=Bathymodiolus japonicus methanotrophic gill symbiont TaxID=113269 RepID=UPI001B451266|nr:type II toxin-antitoxin system HicA family toxin [Bathymodiolus japonicus methanotrophic gill symbiont]GFO72829.1 toxin [Bathymodiolus japonicus methanotrophic gill symbiont]
MATTNGSTAIRDKILASLARYRALRIGKFPCAFWRLSARPGLTAEAKALLRKLDFELKDGRRGGHKVYTHPHIASFTSGSLNCDHGRNPEIKKPYIKKIIKVLEKYKNELVKYLEKRNE